MGLFDTKKQGISLNIGIYSSYCYVNAFSTSVNAGFVINMCY